MNHYIVCETLWPIIHEIYTKLTGIQLDLNIFNTLGINDPSSEALPDKKCIQSLAHCVFVAADVYRTISKLQKQIQRSTQGTKAHVDKSFRSLQLHTTLPAHITVPMRISKKTCPTKLSIFDEIRTNTDKLANKFNDSDNLPVRNHVDTAPQPPQYPTPALAPKAKAYKTQPFIRLIPGLPTKKII